MKAFCLILLSALLATLYFTPHLRAAVTVSVCASGCTETSLQIALDSTAVCGDTIEIKSTEPQVGNFTITNRGCTSADAITVTSDRAAWCPGTGVRATPGDLPNMAIIATANTDPALAAVLDGSSLPPVGWNFRCVAFRSSTTGATYAIVALNNYAATGSSQAADYITFDQCFFYSTLPNAYAKTVQNMIRADGKHITVKNSFVGDGLWHGIESHGIAIHTGEGPYTFTNNFIYASGIPIFSGGDVPTYGAYVQNGVTQRYNYTWRPWKWNFDPDQPNAADYVTNASGNVVFSAMTITNVSNTGVVTITGAPYMGEDGAKSGYMLSISGVGGCTVANASNWRIQIVSGGSTVQLLNFPGCNSAYTSGGSADGIGLFPCAKNQSEFKFGQGILVEYNVGENSWRVPSCGSQDTAYTNTLRTQFDQNIFVGTMGTIAFTDTTHVTWDGTYRIGNTGTGATSSYVHDLGLCVSLTTYGMECRAITSYTGASATVSPAFSSTGGAGHTWAIVYTGSAQLSNVIVRSNVYRNTDSGMFTLALAQSNGSGNSGRGYNISVTNNLLHFNNSYMKGYFGFLIGAGECDIAATASNYEWSHNTIYASQARQSAWVWLSAAGYSGCDHKQPLFDSVKFNDNLFGESNASVAIGGDGNTTIIGAENAFMTNSEFLHNWAPGATVGSGATGGNSASGNIVSSWVDPYGGKAAQGIHKVISGSALGGGHDGYSIGVNWDKEPVITNLQVKAQATHALLSATLNAPIQDAASTQPCTLEVSTSRNLHSDLDTFTVINDLNPAYFKQATASTRTNALLTRPIMTNGKLYFPIGHNGSTTDDGSVSRDRSLTAATTYYGRLMCYGDTNWFTFTTAAADSGASSTTLKLGSVPTGTANVRIQYGSTYALGSTTSNVAPSGGKVSLTLPLTEFTYYQIEYLNGGGSVIQTTPLAVR